MNKTIYMTYKKDIPEIVGERWLTLNPDYKIDLSLDKDCIEFLNKNFNSNVSNYFKIITKGMYKADLWRLCKLYINAGVYADVDLVPYLNIDRLDKTIEFYSCISCMNIHGGSIFQAFIINFSKAKNPLFLVFLISFLINKHKHYFVQPTIDMYKCIKYMINDESITHDKKYEIDEIKMKIEIGPSNINTKEIDLSYFPDDIQYSIKLHNNIFKDEFNFNITNNLLTVKRTDSPNGWGYNHSIDIIFPQKTSFYFFKEEVVKEVGKEVSIKDCYISLHGTKILDSRDPNYFYNKGW